MFDVLLWSFASKALYAGAAVALLWALLRLWNGLTANRFDDTFEQLVREPGPAATYYGLRFVGLAILVGLLMACTAQAAPFPRTYDRQIEQSAQRFLPAVPWRLYKAQLYQESRLDPAARSPAGAEGIAQFMPGTAGDVFPLLGYGALDRRLAEPSIAAGAFYMARLRAAWSSPRPWEDRHRLALASYNAGLGHILASQRACGGALLYEPLMACLPQITGRHAAETLGYAPSIWRWWQRMERAP